MAAPITGDDLERLMDAADDDGGREYLTGLGYDLPSVLAKAQGLAIALFEEEPNPHKCAAAAFLIGLEVSSRAMEQLRGVNLHA